MSPAATSEYPGGSAGLSPATFARFARYITDELGIKMPDSKLTMVHSRLLRRVRDLRLSSVEQYAEYFFGAPDGAERDHLISAITTNKTDFFREPAHFEYLVNTALPSLAGAVREGCRLKVWSAGCSSGEEPYTLAMVLAEYARMRPGFDFAILGTDVSTKVLEQARLGIYRASQVDAVPPGLRKKYLLRSRNKSASLARIVPDLRRKVSFHRLNFTDEEYPIKDSFDVIFFRNVMIYFDASMQESVVNRMCRNLNPGGYLFVGHSESLAGLDIPVRHLRPSIFRKPG